MKKLFLVMCIALTSAGSLSAKGLMDAEQKEKWAAGVNVGYGTKISNVGFGVKGQYSFTDHIRVEAGFDYYLKKDYTKMWDINVNAHYLFKIKGGFKVYPIVGLSYSHWKGGFGDFGIDWDDDDWYWVKASTRSGDDYWGWDDDDDDDDDNDDDDDDSGSGSTSKFGVNLGAGAQYDINNKWAVNLEVKGQVLGSGYSQCIINAGVIYKF